MLIAGFSLVGIGITTIACIVFYAYRTFGSWAYFWFCANYGGAMASVILILVVFGAALILLGIAMLTAYMINEKKPKAFVVQDDTTRYISEPAFSFGETEYFPEEYIFPRLPNGQHHGIIVGVRGSFYGKSVVLESDSAVVIGRDPQMANIIIESEFNYVSRKHCIIRFNRQKDLYEVFDCSTNGTFYNKKRLTPASYNELPHGAVIGIGSAANLFRLA